MAILRGAKIEKESSVSRRLTMRLPNDCVVFLEKAVKASERKAGAGSGAAWNMTTAVEWCVRAQMERYKGRV